MQNTKDLGLWGGACTHVRSCARRRARTCRQVLRFIQQSKAAREGEIEIKEEDLLGYSQASQPTPF